ncbi:hypothetical protein UFOVP1366_29 [uncultured Caudovirales phage]|uniref:Uncharacterized protein n=1 Tax=uncultured Caudovirales phage TaxID=2100421 RepID=A0A6J5S3F5_9CAUD|nr:hypothetical protein UFOVP1366_29 [uncultured Caudovirales phage]
MAIAPTNPTQLTPPRVAFIDERSGAVSREWYRFFLSLLTATETNQDVGFTPPSLGGTVTSANASGGTTGLTFTGGPITTSGTLTLGGTLATANGGTGQTTYTNGQLLIGDTAGNTLTPATLTAGANITITNAAGSVTVAVSGLGTMAFQNTGASGSFIAGINTVTVTNGIITSIV